jgi:hypothetical protein
MKKIFCVIAMSGFLIGCSDGNAESSNTQKRSGLFAGAIDGDEYKVEVSCSYFDEDYFQFKSDKTDVSDSNGDGIVISGMETNGKFTLTIIDNGKTFSAGSLSDFSKGDNKATGSGKLYEEGEPGAHDVQFSVSCG